MRLTAQRRAQIVHNIESAKEACAMDYGAYVCADDAELLLAEIDALEAENESNRLEAAKFYQHAKEVDAKIGELERENERLKARVARLREALEFLSCDGMDDGDFYSEEDITSATIMMANTARRVLKADESEGG